MDRLEEIRKAIEQPLEGLLYDLDLMPEQCKTPINELRSGVVECQYKEIARLKKALEEISTKLGGHFFVKELAGEEADPLISPIAEIIEQALKEK